MNSGVPQGSVIGPVLFLIIANSMHVSHGSSLRLFADDARISRKISCQQDVAGLQADLDELQIWASENGMSFNDDKCVIQRFGHTNVPATYKINSVALSSIAVHKDLGVLIDSKLDSRRKLAML